LNPHEIEEDEIDISKIIAHLKRNVRMILFITFLITSLAAVYAYFLQPIYSSSVSISFSDDNKMSKLSSIVPEDLTSLGMTESALETTKLTIETRKFINSVIADMFLSQRYFIERNFKKNEYYGLDALEVNLEIHDEAYQLSNPGNTLYGAYFKIEPFNDEQYILTIEDLDYNEVHRYGRTISKEFFSIHIEKKEALEETTYFVKVHNKDLLADEILNNLTVTILSDNVLQITYNDTVPRRAKELVEAIAKKFIAYTLEKKREEIGQTLTFLDTQIADIKISLASEGDILKRYQEKSDAFMPLESSRLLMESISKKEEVLKTLEFQYAEVSSFKKALLFNKLNTVSLLNSGINTASIQSLIELFRAEGLALSEMELQAKNIEKSLTTNTQLTALIDTLNSKKRLLVDLNFNFTAGHPQVLQTQSDITSLENEIRSYIVTHISKLKSNIKLTKNKIVNNIDMTKLSLNRKIKDLRKDIATQQHSLQALPEKDLTTQELKRKFTLSENIYTFLLQKKMEFEISKASTIANTQIIEDPREGLKPIKPNKKLIMIVGFIVGLILGVLFTALRAMLDTKIRNAATVESLTDIPLYGILPEKSNIRFFKEALRSIRTNLHFVLPNEKKCVTMLVSSTVPSEGKTTVIAGLAEIMSQINKRVLVMDLDLRKPRLYQELQKSNKMGVTNYLVEDKGIEELVQPINDNLDFIAAGSVPPNPSELLMSERFDALVNQLMDQYDYILFDTAPIGTVIDASLILKHTDVSLLVVKANVAEKSYLENFNRLRKEKEMKSVGIILNQVKTTKSKDYGYGYGYGYGYDYGDADTQHKGA